MKSLAIFLMFTAAIAAPAATKKKAAKKTDTAAASPTIKPLVIPPDAVANANGSYSWTDKQGKKWIFNKTPFGVSRMEDVGVAENAAATPGREQFVTATDAGDTVRFVRRTPFGENKWEKKKTELTEEERRILDSQSGKQ